MNQCAAEELQRAESRLAALLKELGIDRNSPEQKAWEATSAILGFEAMLAHLFTSFQVLHDVLLALAAVGFFIFWIRT